MCEYSPTPHTIVVFLLKRNSLEPMIAVKFGPMREIIGPEYAYGKAGDAKSILTRSHLPPTRPAERPAKAPSFCACWKRSHFIEDTKQRKEGPTRVHLATASIGSFLAVSELLGDSMSKVASQ